MLWSRLTDSLADDPGSIARREHSEWLTRAITGQREFPRIPVRRVDRGGFAFLADLHSGLAWAARWWQAALRRVED
ncbi:MAG: hypothetical protein AB7Q00_03860 [Phycisphaerales bacterium]